jgi:hypothetical protein
LLLPLLPNGRLLLHYSSIFRNLMNRGFQWYRLWGVSTSFNFAKLWNFWTPCIVSHHFGPLKIDTCLALSHSPRTHEKMKHWVTFIVT